jgi:decaprenylphospho-beta-D-erythro-pentofuranosid-2-ulose 2-reductase
MNDAFGHPQSVVVLGGTSDIAREIIALLVADRCRTVVLAGRNEAALEQVAEVSHAAGANAVETVAFDATEVERAETTVDECFEVAHGHVDLVIMAVGELGQQLADEAEVDRIARMVTVNFTWPVAAMTAAATRLRAQGHGAIVVLSSVAGVRVRRANFLYGSAKAGLDAYAQGLAESLRGSGVSLHIVRPGFVMTKMTRGRSAPPFAVEPEVVAAAVVQGIERGHRVIWTPTTLRVLFFFFRLLPHSVWRRLRG